ncbi:hypothetical protein D3C71_1904170 [compost metagenome]
MFISFDVHTTIERELVLDTVISHRCLRLELSLRFTEELKASIRRKPHDLNQLFRYLSNGWASNRGIRFWKFNNDVRHVKAPVNDHKINGIKPEAETPDSI